MNKINFLQINLRRCKKAHDLMDQYVIEKDVDVILISEQNKKIAENKNYTIDTNNDAAIWIRNNTIKTCKVIREHGFIGIITEPATIIISVYISPNIHIESYKNIIDNICNTVRHYRGYNYIIGGDFNAKAVDWGNRRTDERGDIILEIMASEGLCLLNEGDTPTFVSKDKQSIPDITLCSESIVRSMNNWSVETEEETGSDHRYITFSYSQQLEDTNRDKDNQRPSTRWRINQEDLDKLQRKFQELESQYTQITPNEMLQLIYDACKITLKGPKKGRQKMGVYWWNSHIAECRRECIKTRRLMTRERSNTGRISETLWQTYKEAKWKLNREIDKSKTNCWNLICEEVNKDIWGAGYRIVMKKFGLKTTQPSDSLEKEIINELFPTKQLPNWERLEIDPTTIPIITIEELVDAATKMRNNKAPGPDGVVSEIVKCLALACPDYVLKVFNKILTERNFPEFWKISKLVLIPKPGKPVLQPSSYRPLCLLDTCGKLLEGILVQRIFENLGENGLSSHQFGFRPQRSTVNAIQRVYDIANTERQKSRRKRGLCLLITLDTKNAFNSASWQQIIDALHDKNIPTYLIQIFMSYFTSRKIVTSNNLLINTSSGAPQGSKSAPVLWNILYDGVFDLPLHPKVFLTAYADDLAVVVVGKDAATIESTANESLNKINTWMREHELQLAPDKSEAVLLIGRKRCGPINIHIDGNQIMLKDQVKYLGVVLDRQMNFGPHIDYVAKKATARTEALIRLMPRHGGATWKRRKLLNCVVESAILYAAPVWKQVTMVKTHMNKLFKIQRRMTLGITRAYRTTSTAALQVLAGVIPIDFLILERSNNFGRSENERLQEREETLDKWDERWSRTDTGSWTRKLIPKIKHWVTREHGDLTYHMTQILSGHGNFTAYLHRFKIKTNPRCRYCDAVDSAEHTMFQCTRWTQNRSDAQNKTGATLTVENLVPTMLKSEGNWTIISATMSSIMKQKELDAGPRT